MAKLGKERSAERRLLTVAETAEQIGVSKYGVYDLIRSGDIPSVRISEKRLRVPVAALDEWIQSHVTGTPER